MNSIFWWLTPGAIFCIDQQWYMTAMSEFLPWGTKDNYVMLDLGSSAFKLMDMRLNYGRLEKRSK